MTLKLRTKVVFPPTVQGGSGVAISKANGIWTVAADVDSISSKVSQDIILDQDDMASDSATKAPSQQSVKAFVEGKIIDEDDMASDSATKAPTQQSVKAYTDAVYAASRSALANVNGAIHPVVVLYESGREGVFAWDNTDRSTEVASDTRQGLYVAPAAHTTGENGAWRRIGVGEIDIRWFGISGVDDTAAINAFMKEVKRTKMAGVVHGGDTYPFSEPLTPVSGDNFIIRGDSPYGAVFKYTGTTTDQDLMVFGDGINQYYGLKLTGFRVASDTTMTDGAAIRLKKQVNYFVDVTIDGQVLGNKKLYHGIWGDGGSMGDVAGDIYAAQDGIRLNDCVLITVDRAKVKGAVNGIHAGGGVLDLETDRLAVTQCQVGFRVDTLISAVGNDQFFVGQQTAVDSSTAHNYYLDDAISSSDKRFIFAGWGASATNGGHGIAIINWLDGRVSVNGGLLNNNAGDAIYYGDSSVEVDIDAAATLADNTGWAVFAASATTKIRSLAQARNNGAGNYNTNIALATEFSGATGTFNKNIAFTGDPSSQWTEDAAGNSKVVANGDALTFTAGSGYAEVKSVEDNQLCLVRLARGGVAIIDQSTASFFEISTTPTAGHIGIAYSGSAYTIYNNSGGSRTFRVHSVRLDTSN